ncbi:MAG: hypothetical protein SRB1_01513 [Desulfobacteraceae bacterium Eth-SRB1]|nr:MAG: hypothetical protein SRB1_01513 [Desulfobacteraceae bacterium Eth-SRB1]
MFRASEKSQVMAFRGITSLKAINMPYDKIHKNTTKSSIIYFTPKLNGFLLDLRRSLAHKGFAKILDPPQADLRFSEFRKLTYLQILMHQDLSTYLRKKSLNLGCNKTIKMINCIFVKY